MATAALLAPPVATQRGEGPEQPFFPVGVLVDPAASEVSPLAYADPVVTVYGNPDAIGPDGPAMDFMGDTGVDPGNGLLGWRRIMNLPPGWRRVQQPQRQPVGTGFNHNANTDPSQQTGVGNLRPHTEWQQIFGGLAYPSVTEAEVTLMPDARYFGTPLTDQLVNDQWRAWSTPTPTTASTNQDLTGVVPYTEVM